MVASKLVETHQKTVFLWGREGGEVLRGSCRSDGNVNVVELMQGASDAFDHFGGHFASGGFSILEDIQRAGTEFYSQMRNEWLSEISKKKEKDNA